MESRAKNTSINSQSGGEIGKREGSYVSCISKKMRIFERLVTGSGSILDAPWLGHQNLRGRVGNFAVLQQVLGPGRKGIWEGGKVAGRVVENGTGG